MRYLTDEKKNLIIAQCKREEYRKIDFLDGCRQNGLSCDEISLADFKLYLKPLVESTICNCLWYDRSQQYNITLEIHTK